MRLGDFKRPWSGERVPGGPCARAFTLLELLVAMGITALIAGLLLTVTTQLLALWQRQQGQQMQAVAAKLALDLIERDWQAAVRSHEASGWFAAEIIETPAGLANHGWLVGGSLRKPAAGGSLNVLPAPDAAGRRELAQARFGLSGVWWRFVTTNTEADGSLPVVVAYQVVRRPITGDPVAGNPAPVRYALYRSAVSVAQTFLDGYDVLADDYRSTSQAPAAYRSARSITNPSHASLLASHVVDFGCWFYRREADGSLRRIYPEQTGDLAHVASGFGGAAASRYPDVVDVFIRVLSESGAARLAAAEAGQLGLRPARYADDAAWWWALVEENSAVFTRRIERKGGAG